MSPAHWGPDLGAAEAEAVERLLVPRTSLSGGAEGPLKAKCSHQVPEVCV